MPTYLDCIPNDIHEHIAYHLYSSMQYAEEYCCLSCCVHSLEDDKNLDGLLNYAKESPAQKGSVMRAMSHRLHITGQWRKERIIDWISLYANRLRELDMSHAPKFSFPGTPPRLSKLRKAAIVPEPEQLSLIHSSPKLTEVKVDLFDIQLWDGLVSTIASLSLTTLHLRFCTPFMMKEMSRIDLMSLRHATPDVESLYLDSFTTPEIWYMIKRMPSLRKLKVMGLIGEEHIPFLQTLSELELHYPSKFEDLSSLASVITSLTICVYERERMSDLASLSNLRELRIRVEPGFERDLVDAIDSVESLHLSWDYEECDDYDGIPGGPYSYREYYEPDGNDLEDIVASATHLKSLQIKNAILSAKVIRELLKIRGNQLETLEISHDWQRENVPTRMESILKDIALYCQNLTTLNFLEGYDSILPIFAEEEQSAKCLQALKGVVEAVPGFKSYRHIRNIIEHRFTNRRFAGILAWDLMPLNDVAE